MLTSTFRSYLNQSIAIEHSWLNVALCKHATLQFYQKDEVIYKRGKIPRQLSYIESGNTIALSQAKPNRQVLRFWSDKQFICPLGFFDNSKCTHSIVAIDDCVITALNYNQLLSFLAAYPLGYQIINQLISNEITAIQLLIKSYAQNQPIQQHEAFLSALSVTFNE